MSGANPDSEARSDAVDDDRVYYTVEEAARLLKVSSRWLADQCRNDKVEHVHLARKRKFTPAQVRKLLASFTRVPDEAERRRQSTVSRAARRVQRNGYTGRS